MMRKLLLVLLSVLVLLTGCAKVVSDQPCPRVTEFPAALQAKASLELDGSPALKQMMDAMGADREFNRAVCG
nr:hypothetical protein [uncultured Roseococcus sp.]